MDKRIQRIIRNLKEIKVDALSLLEEDPLDPEEEQFLELDLFYDRIDDLISELEGATK